MRNTLLLNKEIGRDSNNKNAECYDLGRMLKLILVLDVKSTLLGSLLEGIADLGQ